MKRILRLGSLESPSRSLRSKLKGERWTKEEGFPLLYHGYSTMRELRSQEEAMAALQTVKQTSREQQVVQVKCRGTELSVVDAKDEQLLSCSLLSVAQCVQETTHGFSDCIAVVFSSGAWSGQCHVFQAKSPREAADIAHSLQKHVKFAHRLTGRKRADSGGTTGVSYTPSLLHRGFSEPMGHQTTPPSPSDRLGVRNRDSDTGSPIPTTTTRDRSPSSSRGGSSQQAPVSPRSRRLFRKQKELTRLERAEHVCKASIAVEDSCAHLLAACRKPHPQSPFEKVLSAIGSSDMAALKDLLELKLLGIDSCDHDGNTLLHYAVSAGSVGAVRMLAERMAAINGPNVTKTRPLHRAAATGRPTMVRLLLDMGASVNALDEMSRTPLHLAAARGGTHLESVWVLLEHGASINTADGIGMRPLDLLPSVKEMQTRLIASVCKNFADPPERNTSPTNASPYLSSSPSLRGPYDGRDIGDLVQVVQGQARSLRSWALSRRNKNKAKKTISRSFSNLSELLEVDEDEMYRQDRLKKLQFPTGDYTPEYLEIVGGAEEVQSKLNSLIRRGRSASKGIKRSSSDPELSTSQEDRTDGGGNKPQIVVGGDIQAAMADTFSALLQRFSTDQDHPAERRRRSGRVSIGSNLSEAFDSLQQDLQTEGGVARVEKEEVVKISPQTTHKFKHHHHHHHHQQPVSDGQVHSHSKEETVAILDDIVADIMSAAEDCNQQQNRAELTARPASARTRRKSAVTRREVIKDSSSSSESKRRLSLSDARQFLGSADSAASSTSSSLSSLHDPQYRSHRSSSLAIAGLPYDPDSREAGLDQLVILSANKECLNTLVSHMGLPKFAERLILLARSPQSSDSLLLSIATLIQNIFEGGGPEGRKLAVEAGLLDTIVKLLSTRDPIPGTCLVLLNSLLVSDDDNDYLRTIVRIPADPLLSFLEPSESDIDSGFDRDMSVSVTTHSSSDDPRAMDPSFLIPPAAWSKDRASSLLSSDSSSSRSVASPTIQVGHYISASEARRIVLKMLAVSSTHHKMKESLRAERTLSLLTDYLNTTSHENITNTIIALANIAQNIACHHYLLQIGIADRLKPLLGKGPRPRYHALRLLVYIGKLKLNGLSLYDSTGYEMDSITHTTADHHQYVRGATIEKSVDLLTGDDSRSLWGGIALPDTSHHPSRDKIAEFFLSTYHSYMHPVLLMRLLLHRLDDNSSSNPFGWMRDLDSLSPSHLHTIPHHHQAVLNLLHMWVELLPEDFRNHTRLQDYVKELVDRMKKYRGVYTSHAHRLRSLMHDLQHSPTHSRSESTSPRAGAGKKRKPHHENLYIQCKQLVCEGHLPVTAEQAVLLAALQLHIETLADSELKQAYHEGLRTKKHHRLFLTHLKKALPVMYSKAKKIAKRTSEKMAEFNGTGMSDRNAKHLYIQRCQETPGYNCTFYSVKVPSVSKFRRSSQTHILGISDSHLVLLDDKTRELTSTHSLQEVRRVSHTQTDPCSLSIVLDHTVIKLHADKESAARQIVLSLDNCGQKVLQSYEQADLDEWVTSWSQSAPSLHTPDDSSSSHDDSRDLPANGSLTSPPPPDMPQETWPAATTELEATFCNCPPDPDFPLNIDIKLLALSEILEHPMELARQLTLLDHSKFGSITRRELLMRVNLVPRLSSEQQSNEGEPGVERLAYQFNQVANWVAHCVLQYHSPEDRAWSIVQFIEMAQYCLQYRNYSSMMAIVVAGLLSPYIRRLKKTWMHVGKVHTSQFKQMETLLSSRNNYKNYRDMLDHAALPAVPFVAIFTRDLRFICDGNPDYLRNGLVNLHKRRQIFSKLEEVRHYQCERYNFEPVPALQHMIESYSLVSEDELHALSRSLEQKSVVGGRLGGRPRSNSISSLTNIVTLKPPLGKAMRGSSTNNLFL